MIPELKPDSMIKNSTETTFDVVIDKIDFNYDPREKSYEQNDQYENDLSAESMSPDDTNNDSAEVVSETSSSTVKIKPHKSKSKNKKHLVCGHIFKAIFIRLLFIVQCLCFIFFILCQTNAKELIALSAPLFVIIIDGLYVCVKRKGSK